MGKVYLIGAGPGDPDLLTLKAARLLSRADVILHDGLVSSAILELSAGSAERVDVGKRYRHKLLTQAEINALLVHYAQRHPLVVRLKGGDPSIFGRSGEEIEALAEAAIEFEIVPGITTAVAAAAAAKISLTDRRFASSITLMTASREAQGVVEWDRLVTSGSTLSIYMPGRRYAELSRNLQIAGMSPSTPCVVMSSVSLPDQQRLVTTVGQLEGLAPLPAPAHVIVGECANPYNSNAVLTHDSLQDAVAITERQML